MGAGGSYPVWRGQANNEVRIGLDLVYFAYDKNLRFFSLGQGGYFSPQSYFAALFPVHYTSKSDDLDWSIGGSVGVAVFGTVFNNRLAVNLTKHVPTAALAKLHGTSVTANPAAVK